MADIVFTGIVEERGEVRVLEPGRGGARLEIACGSLVADAAVGSSVAVDGCCVTIVELTPEGFAAELSEETTRVTCLGGYAPGDEVNLERPVTAGGRLGGHLVQGHVDAVGEVLAVDPGGNATLVRVSVPGHLQDYLVPKGSVAVHGASLTVVDTGPGWFSVWLVPHTSAVTTLGTLEPGDRVNLEVDVIAKYVRSLLAGGSGSVYAPPPDPNGRS